MSHSIKDISTQNAPLQATSTLLTCVNISAITILFLSPLYFIIKCVLSQLKDVHFKSNKPSYFTLFYCIISDILIWFTFLCIFIKMCLYYLQRSNYCHQYKDNNQCNSDTICKWTAEIGYASENVQYVDPEGCYQDHDAVYTFLRTWMILFILKSMYDCWCVCKIYDITTRYNQRWIYGIDCWLICAKTNIKQQYLEAKLWTCNGLVRFLKYGIDFIFSIIYYSMLSYKEIGDYAIQWYELLSIIVLLISKYCVESIYWMNTTYNIEEEMRRFKRYQLKIKFAMICNIFDLEIERDIMRIIFEFNDEYFDGIEDDDYEEDKMVSVCCKRSKQGYESIPVLEIDQCYDDKYEIQMLYCNVN
eukprot:91885_1